MLIFTWACDFEGSSIMQKTVSESHAMCYTGKNIPDQVKEEFEMTYEELVKQVQEAYKDADASKIKEHLAIQFNLEVAEGKVTVQPYEYYDRDALVTTKAAVLEEIAAGKLDVVKAFLTGKIKVEGNVGKAALLKEIPVKSPVEAENKTVKGKMKKS